MGGSGTGAGSRGRARRRQVEQMVVVILHIQRIEVVHAGELCEEGKRRTDCALPQHKASPLPRVRTTPGTSSSIPSHVMLSTTALQGLSICY